MGNTMCFKPDNLCGGWGMAPFYMLCKLQALVRGDQI